MFGYALYIITFLIRTLIPVAVTLAFLLVEGLLTGFPGWYYLVPMATVPCVFFWSVYRPGFMPLIAAVFIGLAEGALLNTPLGLAVIPLVLTVAWVEISGRAVRQSGFSFQWFTVTILIFVKILLYVAFEFALGKDGAYVVWAYYVNKLVMGTVFYPITHLVLSWVNFAMGNP